MRAGRLRRRNQFPFFLRQGAALTAIAWGWTFLAAPAWALDQALAEEVARMARELQPRLVETRRHLHMYPELSNREEKTARYLEQRLRELGVEEIRTGVGRYGITALIKGAMPGPVVALRADMDALPMEETIDVPYKSRHPGVKHACGHDVHMTVQLGAADILMRLRRKFRGTVKLIFQPAEEGPPEGEEGGAGLMIKEGALENPRPEVIFGLHARPQSEVGEIAYTKGAAMASSDRFRIRIRGEKVHAAYPHLGVDPVVVAAEAVLALQHIRSRRVDQTESLVISVGMVQGGNRFNIIPEEVTLEGTIRTLNEATREQVRGLMRRTLEGVTAAYGARYELEFLQGNPVTYNEPSLVEETLPVMRQVLGEKNVKEVRGEMGAEDFSLFQQVIPGFYYWLGVGNRARGITAMIHTPAFDADEESLVVGSRLMASIVLDYLARHAAEGN